MPPDTPPTNGATPPNSPASGNTSPGTGATPPGSGAPPSGNTPPPTPGAGEPPARVVPETYDLKLPKDAVIDAKAVERISAFAKQHKLTQAEAQAALENANSELASARESAKTQWDQQVDKWEETSMNDPEFGGAKYDATVKRANALIQKFGSPDLQKLLAGGLGNHPEIIRFVHRVAAHFTDDDLVLTPGPTGGGGKEKSTAEVLYGSSTPS